MSTPAISKVTSAQLTALEEKHPEGLTLAQILGCLEHEGIHIAVATFRKYVQRGLLPQSQLVRRENGGMHSGSQGLYPATAIRYLLEIRARRSAGETLAKIRQNMRAAILQDALGRRFANVWRALQAEIAGRRDLNSRSRHTHLQELAALAEKAQALMAHLARLTQTIQGSTIHPSSP